MCVMGIKAKKALMKKVKKSFSDLVVSNRSESSEFLPLEGGPGRKLSKSSKQEDEEKNTATVVYIGRIPHGFFEDQMEGSSISISLYLHSMIRYVLSQRADCIVLWKGANCKYQPLDWLKIERERHDKERTVEEHRRLVERILKRDKKRSQKIQAAGIDYECPEIVGGFQPAPKKIKFEEDEEE
ncbi:hypothetical protein ACLOJK_024963 [Asimina triloba]